MMTAHLPLALISLILSWISAFFITVYGNEFHMVSFETVCHHVKCNGLLYPATFIYIFYGFLTLI